MDQLQLERDKEKEKGSNRENEWERNYRKVKEDYETLSSRYEEKCEKYRTAKNRCKCSFSEKFTVSLVSLIDCSA
jgi:hypothetical protein